MLLLYPLCPRTAISRMNIGRNCSVQGQILVHPSEFAALAAESPTISLRCPRPPGTINICTRFQAAGPSAIQTSLTEKCSGKSRRPKFHANSKMSSTAAGHSALGSGPSTHPQYPKRRHEVLNCENERSLLFKSCLQGQRQNENPLNASALLIDLWDKMSSVREECPSRRACGKLVSLHQATATSMQTVLAT